MDHRTALFQRHRRRLLGIAYRMLGSMAEAEDILQDAWLRWNESDDRRAAQPRGLAGDGRQPARGRPAARGAGRARRYPGLWLPEPLVEAIDEDSPQALLERADDVSVALLKVLEQLGPEERAAFVLRQLFDMDYGELAQALGKSEPATRQLVHRASERVRAGRPRFAASPESHRRLVEAFADAAGRGDLDAMRALLTEQAELVGDGGGKVPSFDFVLQGARRLAMVYFAVRRRCAGQLAYRLVRVNGEAGLARFIDGALESVHAFEFDGERIAAIHVQRNPDKLARAAAVTSR